MGFREFKVEFRLGFRLGLVVADGVSWEEGLALLALLLL